MKCVSIFDILIRIRCNIVQYDGSSMMNAQFLLVGNMKKVQFMSLIDLRQPREEKIILPFAYHPSETCHVYLNLRDHSCTKTHDNNSQVIFFQFNIGKLNFEISKNIEIKLLK